LILSIIIPAYNGEYTIEKLFSKIYYELNGKLSFEILFIFDNGTKETWQIIKELKNKFPEFIKAFHLKKNYGQHRAIQFGFSKAQGDFIITIDEDLQHDPADILKLISKQEESDYDIVYGKFINYQNNAIRNKFSIFSRKILTRFIPAIYKYYSPYRLIKKQVALRISEIVSPYVFIDDYLSRVTQKISLVEVTHFKRAIGKSSYSFAKIFKNGVFIILAYSGLVKWTLILASFLLITGTFIFSKGIINNSISTYSIANNKIVISTLMTSGLLLLIGLIGAIINRHNTSKNAKQILLYEDE